MENELYLLSKEQEFFLVPFHFLFLLRKTMIQRTVTFS